MPHGAVSEDVGFWKIGSTEFVFFKEVTDWSIFASSISSNVIPKKGGSYVLEKLNKSFGLVVSRKIAAKIDTKAKMNKKPGILILILPLVLLITACNSGGDREPEPTGDQSNRAAANYCTQSGGVVETRFPCYVTNQNDPLQLFGSGLCKTGPTFYRYVSPPISLSLTCGELRIMPIAPFANRI